MTDSRRPYAQILVLFVALAITLILITKIPRAHWGIILFASKRDGDWDIYSIDIATRAEKQLTVNDTDDFDPVWSPDGQQIAFTSNRSGEAKIYTMNADGSDQRRLTLRNEGEDVPVWLPNDKIAFSSTDNQRQKIYVYVADIRNGTIQRLTEGSQSYESPNWSPDGLQIAFMRDAGTDIGIDVVDVDGNNYRRLTEHHNRVVDRYPVWSPNSHDIAFVSNSDGGADIYLIDEQGNNLRRLTQNNTGGGEIAWSPDGHHITFVRSDKKEGRTFMYIINSDGSHLHRLTSSYGNPAIWSPDGQQIAFVSSTGSLQWDISVINADGTDEQQVTHHLSLVSIPDWRP